MADERVGFQKRFIEGQGYVVQTGPVAAGQPVNEKPAKVALVSSEQSGSAAITRELLEKYAGQLDLVVIPQDEYQDMLGRLGELEAQLSHHAQGGTGTTVTATPFDRIVAAIGQLEQGNKDHFTTNGVPQTKALSEIVGLNVSAKDRDAAFAAYQGGPTSLDGTPALADQIKAAADLDALTALMQDIDDKDLLALADERAEQLKAEG